MDIQSTLVAAGRTFLMLFGELFALFIGISFLVATMTGFAFAILL